MFSLENALNYLLLLENQPSVRVVNGTKALLLERNKVAQDIELRKRNIAVPECVALCGTKSVLRDYFLNQGRKKWSNRKFLLKHNRGGSGSGVRLFSSLENVLTHVDSKDYEAPIDGTTLVQEYIEGDMYRLEFVGGKFMYAVFVDTSTFVEGSKVNNCPADSCVAQLMNTNCPTICNAEIHWTQQLEKKNKFSIVNDFTHPVVHSLEIFCSENKVDICGIEIIVDKRNVAHVIDCNCLNSNYNAEAERRAGFEGKGPKTVVNYLKSFVCLGQDKKEESMNDKIFENKAVNREYDDDIFSLLPINII